MNTSYQNLLLLLADLAKRDDMVVWIRTPDFRRQLYLSPGFEKIWGRDVSELYKHPLRWTDFLLDEERDKKVLDSCSRNPYTANSLFNTNYYRIKHPSGEIRFIRDKMFMIYNAENKIVASAGIAESLPEIQWQSEVDEIEAGSNSQDKTLILIATILQFENGDIIPGLIPEMQNDNLPKHYVFLKNGKHIAITAREKDVLIALIQGLSAKEIAKKLDISNRTVEEYIANIKEKFNCRNKTELITTIHPASLEYLS